MSKTDVNNINVNKANKIAYENKSNENKSHSDIKQTIESYNISYDSQCKDAGDSMPLGGHYVGYNVWTQDNILYLYMAQSGAFDEAGNMVKAGRIKIEFDVNPFKDSYTQKLRLYTGDILIEGVSDNVKTRVLLWTDIKYGSDIF